MYLPGNVPLQGECIQIIVEGHISFEVASKYKLM
jgi:hypothetical protein